MRPPSKGLFVVTRPTWVARLGSLKSLLIPLPYLGSLRHGSDKLAAVFSNSASVNADKFSTIEYFRTLSQQLGQIWIGTGLLPSYTKAYGPADVNWTAGFRRPNCRFAVRRLARGGSTRRRSGDC
jgi:hypothetical protein